MAMIWINPTVFRDLELAKANPPIIDAPEELCDRCERNALSDTAVRVRGRGNRWEYLCEDCGETVERCSACGYVRCVCP